MILPSQIILEPFPSLLVSHRLLPGQVRISDPLDLRLDLPVPSLRLGHSRDCVPMFLTRLLVQPTRCGGSFGSLAIRRGPSSWLVALSLVRRLALSSLLRHDVTIWLVSLREIQHMLGSFHTNTHTHTHRERERESIRLPDNITLNSQRGRIPGQCRQLRCTT